MISILSTIQGIKQIKDGGNIMKLPYLQDLGNIQSRALVFSGINRKDLIEDTEFADGYNLDSEHIPAIGPRKPIELITPLESPKRLFAANNKIAYIDGTNFYYNGVSKGTVSSEVKSLVDFNGNILIFPDKKYYDYIEDTFSTFICPYDIDYATVHYNRVFGIKGSNVYASKVGDFKTWDDYSGTELDSWAADVYSPGDFTGITTYQDHVVFFKSDQMYELYGYTPSQFKILESAKVGCIDDKSISEVGGVLFFMSESGVQTYSGGFPRTISEKLNLDNITSATTVGDGRKFYVSVSGETFIYDTWQNTWMPYIEGEIIEWAKIEDDIYLLKADGIYKLESGTEQVLWGFTSKRFDDGTFRKKSIKTIKLKANLSTGAELKIYVKLDEREWVLHKTIRQVDKFYQTHRDIHITIPIKRAANYQIKLEGKGFATIYGEREFIIGSEK